MEDFEKKSIHNGEVQYEKMIKMFAALFASIIYLSGCFMPKTMYEQMGFFCCRRGPIQQSMTLMQSKNN